MKLGQNVDFCLYFHKKITNHPKSAPNTKNTQVLKWSLLSNIFKVGPYNSPLSSIGGCLGGHVTSAFKYIKDNDGIDTEESYPFEYVNNECRYQRENRGATVTGFVIIESGDVEVLKSAIATIGPISVAMRYEQLSRFYHKGTPI